MTKHKTLHMETTEVRAERSAADISSELIRAGAVQIAMSYEAGKIVGLKWIMRIQGGNVLFEMPARVDPVYQILRKRKGFPADAVHCGYEDSGVPENLDMYAKAERVAWRQLLRWVQAQNAMIETGMVQPLEVFTAYMIRPGTNQTLFQWMMETQFKQLAAPEPKP